MNLTEKLEGQSLPHAGILICTRNLENQLNGNENILHGVAPIDFGRNEIKGGSNFRTARALATGNPAEGAEFSVAFWAIEFAFEIMNDVGHPGEWFDEVSFVAHFGSRRSLRFKFVRFSRLGKAQFGRFRRFVASLGADVTPNLFFACRMRQHVTCTGNYAPTLFATIDSRLGTNSR